MSANGTSRPLILMFRTNGPLRSLASVTVSHPLEAHPLSPSTLSRRSRRRDRKAPTNAPTS